MNWKPMESVTDEWRFAGTKPKVGIRPVIDGRLGGVRESLETRTMHMAKAAARLIAEHVRYPNGTPVECVISDGTIGRAAEAAATQEKFEREGVGATLTVTPCWCYGSETMDMSRHTHKAVWGFNGTERPGAVYLAAVLAGHAQKGLPAFGIYGRDVQDLDDDSLPADVQDKIIRFARSATAAMVMQGKTYLSIGSVSMGIAGSIVDAAFFEDYLGMRCEYVDMSEISRRIENEIYEKNEYERAMAWVKANVSEGEDINTQPMRHSRQQKDAEWECSVKMAIIGKDLMRGNPALAKNGFGEEALGFNAIAGGFQGQRQWTDFLPNGDFMETMLNSSFDWDGIRAPYIFATENDSLNAVSMLFGHLLTGTAQIFCDVRTYWSPEAVKRTTGYSLEGTASGGILHLINSGSACLDGTGQQKRNSKPAMKPFWEISGSEAVACLNSTRFCPADLGYFKGGGFSTNFLTPGGMPVTMCRINLVKGLGPVLQIAEGHTVNLPPEVHTILDRRTSPTWPTTWFAPRLTDLGHFTNVYSVMGAWGANHGAVSYGHIGAHLICLASMLRIPVNMHNVPENEIFRPHAWKLFGTDWEGADYRACGVYGALYR